MNTNHYPSLELCKKLTKIGFPKTQMERIQNSFFKDWISMTDKARNELFDPRCFENLCSTADVKRHYVCPSVMEMLDVIPENIPDWRDRAFSLWTLNMWTFGWFWAVQYGEWLWQTKHYVESKECFPNALAEMILWLHENNYSTSNK